MSTPNILQLFNLAYRHSLARLTQAGQQVDRGWWLLNEKDAWAFLEALEGAENADAWKRNLHRAAQTHGLQVIIPRISIVGLPIKYIYEHETTCVLCGKTA
jgi:hypothetical protein